MPRYKFEPSEVMALYASIMTGAELGQIRLGAFTLEEVLEYHLSMVAIGITSISRCNPEEAHALFIKLGDNLADLIKAELDKSKITLAEVEEELSKDEEEMKQREERFLRNVKSSKWKM